MKHLDPRFGMMAAVIDDPSETPEMRDTACRHAETLATQCGYSLDEALDQARRARPPLLEDDAPQPTASVHHDEDALCPRLGQIEAALAVDATRTDRDIARECGASPTTVGKIRRALGLSSSTRSVSRGGQTYGMTIGDRS